MQERSFFELGFQERTHLQEWIASEPDALGEDLLIIQKEFAEFSETKERLDLLALDKQGSLVIIENKLDDTGRDVTWQALKYASYCAGMNKDGIRRIYQDYLNKWEPGTAAEDKLNSFFETDFATLTVNPGVTQRIILIAANFRKEVTSTVLWLASFKLRIQCFKVTPFSMGDELFLNIDQIIPTKDTEEFMIGLADKAQDEVAIVEAEGRRQKFRREFWSKLISAMNEKTQLYQKISPGTHSWIGAGSGVRGVGLNFGATQKYARAELYIDRGDETQNLDIFDSLKRRQSQIENAFGGELTWERLEGRRACRIKAEGPGDVFDRECWPSMIEYMVDTMLRLDKAMRIPLQEVMKEQGAKSVSEIARNASPEIVGDSD